VQWWGEGKGSLKYQKPVVVDRQRNCAMTKIQALNTFINNFVTHIRNHNVLEALHTRAVNTEKRYCRCQVGNRLAADRSASRRDQLAGSASWNIRLPNPYGRTIIVNSTNFEVCLQFLIACSRASSSNGYQSADFRRTKRATM